MRQLNPTLWRTCRMLTGRTRLRLLRFLLENPNSTVTQLAAMAEIGISDASQELRRIQSRGMLQVDRKGPYVFYRPAPDPQVPSAAPLLTALKTAMKHRPACQDAAIISMAAALAYPRRIAIAQTLLNGPVSPSELIRILHTSPQILNRHLRIMTAGRFLHRHGQRVELLTPPHPVGQALIRLLRP